MPLQIRRGTNAEKNAMSQKLSSGELLWVTDDKKLYIGDGITASSALAPVSGFNAEDAQDAAALLFTTGTHSGIAFSYNDATNRITATVTTEAMEGTIKADGFIGNLYDNSSTLSFNAATGIFNGDLTGDVTGNLTGDVTGNVTGNLLGDIKGSVFGDDSTVIVDSVGITINTTAITAPFNSLNIGTPDSPLFSSFFTSDISQISNFYAISDGTYLPSLNVNVSDGTYLNPTENSGPLGIQGGLNFNTFVGGSFVPQSTLLSRNAIDANFSAIAPGADLVVQVANNTDYSFFVFNHNGIFTAPALQAFTYVNGLSYTGETFTALNGKPEPTPDALNTVIGTIIFDSDLNTFKGYTNDVNETGLPGFTRIQTGTPVAETYTTSTLPAQAAFTGGISGTTLTVSAISLGHIRVGMQVTGGTTAANTFILEDLTGGAYRVNNTQTVAPGTSLLGPDVPDGTIIFVSDETPGSKFKGWDGTSWVTLG
jgi:hypothetical protein